MTSSPALATRFSARPTVGRQKIDARAPGECTRLATARAIVSWTVSPGHRRAAWKERPMPKIERL